MSTNITTLVITDGTDTDTINLVGNYTTTTVWNFSDDSHGGTLISEAPTVVVSGSSATLTAGQIDTITFAFSGAVTGFDLSDVSVTGGALSNLQPVAGDPTHYTAVFTPAAGVNTQTAQIQVLAGGWTDVAGNAGTASNTLAITEDTQAPTVVVSGSSATLAAGETATITFAFSGAVTGFDLSDVSVTGGALSNLQSVAGDPTHYTALFTPTAGVNTQTAQIQVLAGGWSDAAGNAGTASNTLSISEDTRAPTVVVSGSSTSLAAGQTATITFAFSEAVSGFGLSDVSVTGGALSNLQPVAGDPTHYTATFTPAAGFQGSGSVQVLASASGTASWTDTAGNAGSASNILSISEDTQAPTVVVSGSSATLAAGETATITFAFSGAVTGFDLSDVSVTGGALSTLQPVAGDPTHDTAIFTPAAGVNTQTAQIQALAGGWTDVAGNAGTASNTLSITEDTQAPTVVVSGSSATLAAGETATITFAFSGAVTGFDLSDVSVTGGALSDLQPVAATPRTIRPYSRRRPG